MYETVAKKLNLKTEYVQSTPTRKPLLISNGERFFLINTSSPGFYPEARRWNAHFTSSKLLTQKILNQFGYSTLHTYALRVKDYSSQRQLVKFLSTQEYTFPVLVKPDRGKDGEDIRIVEDIRTLKSAAAKLYTHSNDFLIQPIRTEPEYRILVVDYEVVLMHSKRNQSVIGDGIATIKQLLQSIPDKKKDAVYISWQHKKHGTKPSSVLQKGTEFEYHLTKIPSADFYVTEGFHPVIEKWAVGLAKTISSPVVGIDVFIPESFSDPNTFTIIELNSNPALYYLPTRCNDSITGYKIVEKVLRNFFNLT